MKHLIDMYRSFGMIPSSYKVAMSYEEQLMWLCKEILDIESGTGNVEQRLEALETEMPKKQDKLIAGENIIINPETNEISLDGVTMKLYDISSNIVNGYYIDNHDVQVGDILDLSPISGTNTSYILKDILNGEQLNIEGKFTLTKIDKDTNEVLFKYDNTTGERTYYESEADGKVAISFWDTDVYTPKVYEIPNTKYMIYGINKALNSGGGGGGSAEVTKLSQDIILTTECSLPTGLYASGSHSVYITAPLEGTLIISHDQLFYFDNDTQTFYGIIESVTYEFGSWTRQQYSFVTNEIVDNRDKIPTSQAVNRFSWQFENFDKNVDKATTTRIDKYEDLSQSTAYDFSSVNVGDTFTGSAVATPNKASLYEWCYLGEEISIEGSYEYIVTSADDEVLEKGSGTGTTQAPFVISPLYTRKVDQYYKCYINLTDTLSYYRILKLQFVRVTDKISNISKDYEIPNAKDVYENFKGVRDFTKNSAMKLSHICTPLNKNANFNEGYRYDYTDTVIGDTFNPVNVPASGCGNISLSVKLGESLHFGGSSAYMIIITDENNIVKDKTIITGSSPIPTGISPLGLGYEEDLIFYIYTPNYSDRSLFLNTFINIDQSSIDSSSKATEVPSSINVYNAIKNFIKDFGNYNLASTYTIPTNDTYSVAPISQIQVGGTGFTYDDVNHQIVCHQSMKLYCIINETILTTSTSGNRFLRISKNGSQVNTVLTDINGKNVCLVNTCLIDVNDGDNLQVLVYGKSGDKIDAGRLSVTLIQL